MSISNLHNAGFLSKNDYKRTPKQPDHTGTCSIEGVEYHISGWVKEKNGRKFLSLSFTPKLATAPEPQAKQELTNDDIPF